MQPAILAYCVLKGGRAKVNGQTYFAGSQVVDQFLPELYAALGLNYPKFFKMDNLAKLAFLATEALLQSVPNPLHANDNVAQFFMNADSSLDTDLVHQAMINEHRNVSPSVFVYTLPNILMGEIAIKNKWHGENLFILAPDFNVIDWLNEARLLFDLQKATYCIGGWVNCLNGNYEAKLVLAAAYQPAQITIETLKDEFAV